VEEEPKKKKGRLGGPEIAVLIFFALIFDLLSLIPIVNDVVVIVGQALMALFFFIHGVNVFSKKNIIQYLAGWVVEAIPAISIFPTFILETIIIIAVTKFEDKTGIEVSTNPADKLKAPTA
jgi:hypothetical protein